MDVLGDNEEEVPEHGKLKTENYKRITAHVMRNMGLSLPE